jgi:ATP-dependent Clp protease adaptor protein ClpS
MSTEVLPRTGVSEETKLEPRWHVVLLNDDDHTYDYVVEMLGKLFGHDVPTAFAMAREVDTAGRCIVHTDSLERAEFKRDQIHGYGADPRIPRCAGSMSADLEQADG